MEKLQRFNVAIGGILFLLIMLLLLVVPEGAGRLAVFLVAATVFCLCAFAWKAKPPTTLNSFALPALLAGHAPTSYLVAAIGLLILAYVAKAAIDTLTHQAGNNIFERWGKWFDARTSWLNKYKPGSWPSAPVPRFLGSTTVFVWLTDFWHAADSVYLTAYLLGAMLLGVWLGPVQAWPWLLAIVLIKGGGGALFQGCYRLFRITK
ncbi:MAG: hypothetical protein ACRYFZ_11915 [Janthinobacterium lividum]